MNSPIPKSVNDEINKIFIKHPSKIFHYTNVESLFHIVSEKCVFASHIKFLNDWKEYDAGYEKMYNCLLKNEKITSLIKINKSELGIIPSKSPIRSQYYSKISESYDQIVQYYQKKILPEVFAISFCTRGDSLNHWIAYAKEAGVSIEFDFSNFIFIDHSLEQQKEKLLEKGINEGDISFAEEFGDSIPRKIKYVDIYAKDKKIDKLFDEVVNSFLKEIEMESDLYNIRAVFWSYIACLFNLVSFIKTSDFKMEKEVRIGFREQDVIVDTKNGGKEKLQTKVQYRVRNNLIIPFLKIGWKSKDKSIYPIKSITIGPGKNQEAILLSVIQFIEGQDNSIIPVTNSRKFGSDKDGVYTTRNGIEIKLSKVPFIF